jgi:hypothetical protein
MGGFSAAGGVEMKEKMLGLERKGGQRIKHPFAILNV